MAIRKLKNRAAQYQAYWPYWRNPVTKKLESATFQTLGEARKRDSLIKHQIVYEKELFQPQEEKESAQAALNVAISTAHRRLSILRAALSWAAEIDLIEANPYEQEKRDSRRIFVSP